MPLAESAEYMVDLGLLFWGSNRESQAKNGISSYEKDFEKDVIKDFLAFAEWGHAASGLAKCLRQKCLCLRKLEVRVRSYKLSTSNTGCTRNEYVKPDLSWIYCSACDTSLDMLDLICDKNKPCEEYNESL